MLPRPDARRKRARADAARGAMEHRAVRLVAARVVPALDAAGKSLAFADAGNVHKFAGLETVDQHAVARLRFIGRVFDADFAEAPHGSSLHLLEVSGHGLRDTLRLDEFHKP